MTNSFLSGMTDAVKSVEKKVESNEENSTNEYESLISSSYSTLRAFISEAVPDKNKFEKISEQLLSAAKVKPSRPEAYFYLSYLFHIIGETETAVKYLKTVQFIDPEFENLDILRDDILSNN